MLENLLADQTPVAAGPLLRQPNIRLQQCCVAPQIFTDRSGFFYDARLAARRCIKLKMYKKPFPWGDTRSPNNTLIVERSGTDWRVPERSPRVNPQKPSTHSPLLDRPFQGAYAEVHRRVYATLHAAHKEIERSSHLISQSIVIIERVSRTLKRSNQICLRVRPGKLKSDRDA